MTWSALIRSFFLGLQMTAVYRSISEKPLLGRVTRTCTRIPPILRLPLLADSVRPSFVVLELWDDDADPRYTIAVGVPGELRGWELLHRKHGKLSWAKLFEGAIQLARYGFTVNQDLAAALNNGVGGHWLFSRGLWPNQLTSPFFLSPLSLLNRRSGLGGGVRPEWNSP